MPTSHSETGAQRHAELWFRADVPTGADERRRKIRSLARTTSNFERVRCRLVPNRLSQTGPASETPDGEHLLDTAVDIRRWATSEGVDVDPFFPTTDRQAIHADGSRSILTFPTVACVEYVDDEITHVTPHLDGDRVVSVDARLFDLTARDDLNQPTTVPEP